MGIPSTGLYIFPNQGLDAWAHFPEIPELLQDMVRTLSPAVLGFDHEPHGVVHTNYEFDYFSQPVKVFSYVPMLRDLEAEKSVCCCC